MKKYLIISMIILSSSLGLAGENEDFKYVDNLYREKDFKNAFRLFSSENRSELTLIIFFKICSLSCSSYMAKFELYPNISASILKIFAHNE